MPRSHVLLGSSSRGIHRPRHFQIPAHPTHHSCPLYKSSRPQRYRDPLLQPSPNQVFQIRRNDAMHSPQTPHRPDRLVRQPSLYHNPGPNDHLFTWKHPKTGLRPLTKMEVTKRIHQITAQHSLPEVKGHSFRIGGTLHYLLLGTPFDVVKTMGRWSRDLFTRYLQKHALILSPYLIEQPNIIEQLMQYAMLPVR